MAALFATRRALHAKSWYSDRAEELQQQLEGWLRDTMADTTDLAGRRVAGVIAPHAGYAYSGPTAAFAYAHVQAEAIKRVFILGPSHHFYLETCALSAAREYATPIGNMAVDHEANEALRAAGASDAFFQTMSRTVDEEEHSIEMHLPYVAHVMRGREFRVVPILVGNLDEAAEARLGSLLAPWIADPSNFFVVSSDFCHWGSRFRFQRYDKAAGAIHQSIERLDKQGMSIIESKDAAAFAAYLRETRNTICGRHPIGAILHAMQASPLSFEVKFVRYAQSSQCKSMDDSSVSYASAVITCPAGLGG